LEFYFNFDLFIVIGMPFFISVPNFTQIIQCMAELWHHINFQDGGRVGNILPVSDFMMALF